MQLSLVIPVFNGLEYLKLLLKSIERHSSQEHEIVIYSDGSTDGTEEFLAGLSGAVTAHSPDNDGICTAVNRAMAMASGHALFLLNSDHVLGPRWDVNLLRWLGGSRRVVSATCIEPGLVPVAPFFIAYNCGRTWQDFSWERFEMAATRSAKPTAQPGVNHPFAITKALWDEIGGLDERFNPGPASDPDLFYRLTLSGAIMIRADDVVLYHFSGKSSRMADEAKSEHAVWRGHTERCNRLFVAKWGEYYGQTFGEVPQPGPVAQSRFRGLSVKNSAVESAHAEPVA